MSQVCRMIIVMLLLIHISRCQSSSINTNDPVFLSAESENSNSIEIPVRKERSEQSQHRPIVELVLGVLDTFHSSSKSDLKRLKARPTRQNESYQLLLTKTTESPILFKLRVTKSTLKKQFGSSRA